MLFYQLRKQGIYFHQKEGAKLWIRDLLRIAVALVAMAAVLWWLTPVDAWWQAATMLSKIGHLLALVVLAVMAYFGALFLLGVRKADL